MGLHRLDCELMAELEPRALLAGSFNGTDVDGDTFTVTLSGPGDLTVTTSAANNQGFINNLSFANTTSSSKITVSVKQAGGGDGRLRINQIQGSSDLGSIVAKTSDQPGAGFINVGKLGKLEFGDVAGGNTITIGGGDRDKISLLFLNLGIGAGKADVTIGARVSSLSASKIDAELNLTRGADTIKTTAGELAAELNIPENALFPTAIKSLTAKGSLGVSGEVGGRIDSMTGETISGTFDARDIGTIKSTVFAISLNLTAGVIGTVSSKDDLLGTMVVDRVNKIDVKGDVTKFNFNPRTPDSKGVVLGSLKAASVQGVAILVGGGGTAGTIKTIDIGSWSGGQITQGAIETLKVKGDFNPVVTLGLNSAVVALKSASIGGLVRNSWTVFSRIKSLTVGSAGTGLGDRFQLTSGMASMQLEKFVIKSSTATSFIDIAATGIGTLETKGPVRGSVVASGSFEGDIGIKSIKAAHQLDLNIESIAGGIGSLTCTSWTGGLLEVRYVGSVDVKKSGSGDGSVSGVTLQASGQRVSDGFAIRSFKAKGVVESTLINSIAPIGTVDVLDFRLGAIKSGLLSGDLQLNGDLTGFNPIGRIDSVTLRRSFNDNSGDLAMRDGNIVAPTIGKFSVSKLIAADNSGSQFGLGFRTLTGSIRLRDTANKSFSPALPTAPGFVAFDTQLGGPDFLIRVYT